MNTTYAPLPEFPPAAGGHPSRICIATWEIEGPSRNAGIGTAYTNLAEALKRGGFDVTVLFLLGCHPTDGNISEWVEHYKTVRGIKLVPLPMPHHPRIHAAWASSVSYHTYTWLKEHEQEFDVVHLPECQGLGFYSLLAKRQGLAFHQVSFVVGTHGPTFWVKEGSLDYIRNLGELEIDFMERTSVAAADYVVSPSQYLLGWMQRNKWELPKNTFVAPYIRPFHQLADNPAPAQKRAVREIVFFGRLEARKGLKVFCDAIDEICAAGAPAGLEVAFLGKETQMYGRSSIGYISDRSKKWTVPWRIVANKHQGGALEYLRGEGRMAVVASLADNFPNTVMECIAIGVPLLASNVGGIPEIMSAADRERICFEPRPGILADRILDAVKNGMTPVAPSTPFADNERRTINWHLGFKAAAAAQADEWTAEEETFPRVSVCVAYDNHGKGMEALLESLKEQDYPGFEVILVECGPGQPKNPLPHIEKIGSHPIMRLRQKTSEIGAGRNLAAQNATGEYLLFLDDHSVLLPNSISTFVSVARRVKADIVTSAITFFVGSPNSKAEHRLEHSRRPFLGNDVATGAFVNAYGSANALISRAAFTQVGGFSNEATTTLDEWEIFSRAALKGLRIETAPEVLLWHREDQDQESLVHSLMNGMRSVRPYTEQDSTPAESVRHALIKVMQFGQGQKFEHDALLGSPLSRGEQGPAVTG